MFRTQSGYSPGGSLAANCFVRATHPYNDTIIILMRDGSQPGDTSVDSPEASLPLARSGAG
jgi:hypothetical protein